MIEIPLKREDGSVAAVAKIDDIDSGIARYSWSLTTTGYARRATRIAGKYVQFRMHREIMNPPAGFDVDHINGDRTDNRRSNLRIVDRSLNLTNRTKMHGRNTSGFRNVSFDKARGVWGIRVKFRGKVYAERRPTLELAAMRAEEMRNGLGFLKGGAA